VVVNECAVAAKKWTKKPWLELCCRKELEEAFTFFVLNTINVLPACESRMKNQQQKRDEAGSL